MKRALISGMLLAMLTVIANLLPFGAQDAHASASALYVSQACAGDGVTVTFGWEGQDPSALQVWLDLSLQDNGFRPDTFISAGPFSASAASHQWRGIQPSATHYVRINQQLANGSWDPSGTYVVATQACASSVVSIASTASSSNSGSGRPVITNMTCTSSVESATVSNVNPTDRKNAKLNAYAGDTINCTADANGAYTSLAWKGPNNDEGTGGAFTTSAGPLRQQNTPYVVSLRMNWNGNPALADINVYIVSSNAIVTTPATTTTCFPNTTVTVPYNQGVTNPYYPLGNSLTLPSTTLPPTCYNLNVPNTFVVNPPTTAPPGNAPTNIGCGLNPLPSCDYQLLLDHDQAISMQAALHAVPSPAVLTTQCLTFTFGDPGCPVFALAVKADAMYYGYEIGQKNTTKGVIISFPLVGIAQPISIRSR